MLYFYTVRTVRIIFEAENNLSGLKLPLIDQLSCAYSILLMLMTANPLKKNWYVFYTCPRAEKKVNKYLLSLGYQSFLPLKSEFKIWKNRQRKLIESPLFPSYIFVLATRNEIFDINKVYGICCCVTYAGVPAVISDNDILSLKIMQKMNVEVLKNNDLCSGDKVRIVDGLLCGYEGVLIKIKGKEKFGVSISCVNLTAVVDLESSKMEKL